MGVITALFVAILVAGGVLVVNKRKLAPSVLSAVTPIATSTQIDMTPVVPQAKVSMEGWKTCRNEEYGYEFKYPSEWYMYSFPESYATNTQESNYEEKPWSIGKPAENCSGRIVRITVEPIHSDSTEITGYSFDFLNMTTQETIDEVYVSNLKEIIHNNRMIDPNSGQTVKIMKVFNIDGEKAILRGGFYVKNKTDIPNYEQLMFVDKNKKRLATISGSDPLINEITETILSTFRFLK